MREVAPTRSAALELADERKLMRQGYEFLDEKRTLLATEMLQQLRLYQERVALFNEAMKHAAEALAQAVERHGFDGVQVYPAPEAPDIPDNTRTLFLGHHHAGGGRSVTRSTADAVRGRSLAGSQSLPRRRSKGC